MARFANGKAPFLRIADKKGHNTNAIMRDFTIALLPLILFGWWKDGINPYLKNSNYGFLNMIHPILMVIFAGLACYVMEALCMYLMDPECKSLKVLQKKLRVSYPLVPGVLLALVLPSYTPIWVLLFGCFMATVVSKMLFGGFGHNLFNPALIGYISIYAAFGTVIADAAPKGAIDFVTGATPLGALASNMSNLSYEALVKPFGSLWNLFLGTTAGSFGETSALLCIVAYAWLVYRKVINWRVPVIYVGTVFVLTWLIGLTNGVPGIWFPLYNILSGGLFFGAVFMATEPVTTPRNPLGKTIFALLLGTLTVMFRFLGAMPEGVATSILAMNIFSNMIDIASAKIRAVGFKKSVLTPIVTFALIFGVFTTYTAVEASRRYGIYVAPNITADFVSAEQDLTDYTKFYVKGTLTEDGVPSEFTLVYDKDGKYVSTLSGTKPEGSVYEAFNATASNAVKNLTTVVLNVEKTTDGMVVTLKQKANYAITLKYYYVAGQVNRVEIVTTNEDYDWDGSIASGSVEQGFASNFNNFTGVAGATLTSNGLKASLTFANNFAQYLSNYSSTLNNVTPDFETPGQWLLYVTYNDQDQVVVVNNKYEFVEVKGGAEAPSTDLLAKFVAKAKELTKGFGKVVSTTSEAGKTTLVASSSGFEGDVKVTYVIDETTGNVESVTIVSSESYSHDTSYSDFAVENGYKTKTEAGETFTAWAGATYTSNALLACDKVLKAYVSTLATQGGN